MVDVKLAEINQQIAHLHSMKQVLQQFRRRCPGGDKSAASCPFWRAFWKFKTKMSLRFTRSIGPFISASDRVARKSAA